jgi:hypothetical protein
MSPIENPKLMVVVNTAKEKLLKLQRMKVLKTTWKAGGDEVQGVGGGVRCSHSVPRLSAAEEPRPETLSHNMPCEVSL